MHKKGHIRFLKQTSLAAFGINGAKLPQIKLPLTAKAKEFLTYHRDKVFNRD